MAPSDSVPERRYPGRAAYKLLGALEDMPDLRAMIEGRVCLDIGAAHGGFTRVLLEAGAAKVYALDVAYGMLDFNLRRDERVVPLERKNVRHIERSWFAPEDFTHAPWFLTCDAAFISLGTVLAAVAPVLAEAPPVAWDGVFLVKPQFEDSRSAEGGVVRDQARRLELLEAVRERARTLGLVVGVDRPARITGQKGNQEYCLVLSTER